jgi:hypothetical protein
MHTLKPVLSGTTNEYYQHRNFKSEVKRLEQKVIGEEALHA